MEGDTQLMRLIQEMRSEINKLERENKALRGELSQVGNRTINADDYEKSDGIKCSPPLQEEAASKGVLRRNVSVGSTQTLQEQTGTAMTVRRYSMSSPVLHSYGYNKHSIHMKRFSSSATLELNGSAQNKVTAMDGHDLERESVASENLKSNKIPKTRSFQEYMNKCRGKVKTVTFMLPMDMRAYAENQMTFQGPQNQSSNHLSTIIEKDP
ncbi:putative coiled-coil domain-containing protein 195 [Discoglossus pictus]